MIKIRTQKNHLTIQGHANYAPKGFDIVCAGVTALVDSFILSSGKEIKHTVTQDELSITIVKMTPELQGKLGMLITGLVDIAKDYGEYVVIDQAFKSEKDTEQVGVDLKHEET